MTTQNTLGTYYITGIQDCSNALSLDEFDVAEGAGKGWTAAQIVDARLDAGDWQDPKGWIDQQEASDAELLGAIAMWDAWKAGWRVRAIEVVARAMAERPATYRWTVEIEVAATWVADGLDITTDRMTAILSRAFPFARSAELKARVVSAPDADAVAREMGYVSAADRKARQ